MKDKNTTYNINGVQVNIASKNAIINAKQNCRVNESDLHTIIKEIMTDLSDLKSDDAKKITDLVYIAENELTKAKPNIQKLRSCITLLAPIITVVNGIPSLAGNLQKLLNYILSYVSY